MENKIATTIEQSKKLIEVGLRADTADMNYCNASYKGKNYVGEWKLSLQSPQEAKNILDISATDWNTYWEIIPAWSLSALLELIPKEQHSKLILNAHYKWVCEINKPIPFTYKPTVGDNPLDVVFEMIVYLKENKLI